MERSGGSYVVRNGTPVLKEQTVVSEQGSRPFNADGSPAYVRPHEVKTNDETTAPMPVAGTKAKGKGVSDGAEIS